MENLSTEAWDSWRCESHTYHPHLGPDKLFSRRCNSIPFLPSGSQRPKIAGQKTDPKHSIPTSSHLLSPNPLQKAPLQKPCQVGRRPCTFSTLPIWICNFTIHFKLIRAVEGI